MKQIDTLNRQSLKELLRGYYNGMPIYEYLSIEKKAKDFTIEDTVTEKEIDLDTLNEKVLHFFLFFKTKFKHSIVYNYTPEKLSNITGISPNTIRKYIAILKNNGLVKKVNNNLLFINRLKVDEVAKYNFRRRDYNGIESFSQFRETLILNYIKNEANKQEYIIKAKDILKGKGVQSIKQYRKAKAIASKYSNNWKEYNNKVIMSYRSLASKLSLSHTTIKRYIDVLIKQGLITLERITKVIKHNATYNDYLSYKKYNSDNIILQKGKLLLDLGWSPIFS
jgi:DNA-binding transcriptional regulator YhcF (GntR family)